MTIRRNLATHRKHDLAGRTLRFLTLTLRHDNETLSTRLARLTKCLRLLRRLPSWRTRVWGGVIFLEVTKSKTDGCWHPHVHVVYEGHYYPKQALSNDWRQVTGDSYIVDVRMIRSPDELDAYVTKYATKTVPASIVRDDNALAEAIDALAHVRMINTFGKWRSLKLLAPVDPHGWVPLGKLENILEGARLGNPGDRDVIRLLQVKYTTFNPDVDVGDEA